MNHVAALLLAAGQSKRMGRNKQLLPLSDKPFIRHCLDNLLEAGLQHIIVVLGANGQEIKPVISDLPVSIAWNTAQKSDMAGSVRAGMGMLPERVTGVLVCLGDHPLVQAATIQTVITCSNEHPEKIVIPEYAGKKGHPTLFPRAVLEEIFTVATLRDIVHRDADRLALLDIADPGVTIDIDTPDDFQRIASAGLSYS
jgi:CTP:molybdopterin cytidylyltransferase MocA